MNETDKQLAEILKKGLETAEKTGNFIVEQAPDLIRQLLIWKTVEYSVYVILGISLIIYFYRWTKKVSKEMKENEDDFEDYFMDSFANILIAIGQLSLLIIGMILIAENLQDLIQIVFAPKIYLIEYSAKLLGR
jgi:uncharacterized membrane protein YuzA (DUF378 family)